MKKLSLLLLTLLVAGFLLIPTTTFAAKPFSLNFACEEIKCNKEWKKLGRQITRADRFITSAEVICSQGSYTTSDGRRLKRLIQKTDKIVKAIRGELSDVISCCGNNEKFNIEFSDLSKRLSSVCR